MSETYSFLDRVKAYLPGPWRSRPPVVPVVRLSGAIGLSTPLRQSLTLAAAAPLLERAFGLRGARAVAISLNSPGGAAVQSHLIHLRIRALAEQKKLPVYVFIEDVGASGGYMIACAADEIVADPGSIVGSIGVVAAGFGFDRLIERIGIERRVYTAGTRKVILDPFQPEREDEVERLKTLQRDVHESFIALVKARRGARLTAGDETLFTGEFWSGRRALELGLVDGLGDMRSFLRQRFGDKVRLRLIGAPRGFLARRFGFLPASSPAEELIAALEDRAHWARFGL